MRISITVILISFIFPILTAGQGLNIRAGATLINRGNLINKGNWINDGAFSDTSATVIFSGSSQTIGGTSPTAFNNIIISPVASVSVISPGQTLDRILLCNGTINGGGNLIIRSTEKLTGLIDGSGTGNVAGNIIMQRYLPSAFGYKYFSSPFQSATVGEFSDDMNLGTTFSMFYRYNENRTASGWVSYNTPSDILVPLTGYAANFGSSHLSITADISGIVNNGPLSVTLYNHNNTYTKGFNLVGNPYPSPIDWDAPGWIKTNIDNAIHFFKASTTDQYGGTYSSYVGGVSTDPGVATNIIPSMQGFFVHVSNGVFPVEGTLGLDNSVRISNLTHSFIKSDPDESKPLLRLTATFSDNPSSPDPAVIYFDNKAETAFDNKADALKLMNTDLNTPNFFALGSDGSKLSINALPSSLISGCTIPLGIKTSRTGNVVFKIQSISSQLLVTTLYLADLTAGINQDMLSGNQYSVPLAPGEYNGRFFLYLNSSPTDIISTGYNEISFKACYAERMIIADIELPGGDEGTVIITNLTGKPIFSTRVNSPGHYEFKPVIKPGLYIITFITGNHRISRKIIAE